MQISAAEFGWVGSLAALGAAIVAPLAGQLVDKMGRRNCMLSLCLPLCIGWLLMAFAKNVTMLYAGRALTGASTGAFCVAIPVYVSEIAYPPLRGALGSLFQLQLVMGVELIYVAGPMVCEPSTTIKTIVATMQLTNSCQLIWKGCFNCCNN